MGINLLDKPILSFLLKDKRALRGYRLFTLFIFLYAIAFGFFYPSKEENIFTTAVFWSLFWPFFMVITLPTLGNVFCMICPLGFLGRQIKKFGAMRRIPKLLKNPYIGLILFNIIAYWFVLYTFRGFWREPFRTALFFSFFLLLSSITFYFFRSMAFCKYICPIGIVNSAFSRVGFLWLSTDKRKCGNCRKPICALSCPYDLNPSKFDERNSMANCTLCMECAQTCNDVRLELRSWSSSLLKPIRRPYLWEIWVYVLLTGVITFGMRYHHALGRTELAQYMPWVVLAGYIRRTFQIPENIDVAGFTAFIMALITVMVIVATSTLLGSKVSGIPPRKVFIETGYALAPLMIVGSFSHVLEFFFISYYYNVVNGFSQAFHLGIHVEPLTDRDNPYLYVFHFFPLLAGLWSLYILKRRIAFLNIRNKKLLYCISSFLPVFYILLWAFSTYATLFLRITDR